MLRIMLEQYPRERFFDLEKYSTNNDVYLSYSYEPDLIAFQADKNDCEAGA